MKTLFYRILAVVLRALVRTVGRSIYKLRILGVENIPSSGGALLVANHASYMDFVMLVSSVPRPVRFIMNADVYFKPGLHWIMKGLNFIPISPRGGKNDFGEFNRAVAEQISAGFIVVIFAEGTVTRTGQLLEFKRGVEHLSAAINAPIIPIHFDNVQGTPFTFRGGRKQIEKFSFRTLRREVRVNIGPPLFGKVSAFMLRQKIKEMEVENFQARIGGMIPLRQRMSDIVRQVEQGMWTDKEGKLHFKELPRKLEKMDHALQQPLSRLKTVGVLLPKSKESFLLNLWLLINGKTVVNIDSTFTNEERYYVCNRAKVKTIITTRDLEYTRFAPTADEVIYIEDLLKAMIEGKSVNVVYKRLQRLGAEVSSWFQPTATHDEVVSVFFTRVSREEMKCVTLTQRNFLAVLTSLRQVYHFDKGKKVLANIELSNVYGYVLEFLLPLMCDMQLDISASENDMEAYIKNMMHTEPALVMATPTQLEAIAETAQMKNIPFLKTVFTADVLPHSHAVQTLIQRGVQVMVCAGMPATTSVFAVNIHNYYGKDIAGKMMQQENLEEGSIGKPIPGIAVKICDDQHNELMHEQTGGIWVKGPAVAPVKTDFPDCSPTLVDGWYYTGWKGKLDHKGFLWLETVAEKNLV